MQRGRTAGIELRYVALLQVEQVLAFQFRQQAGKCVLCRGPQRRFLA